MRIGLVCPYSLTVSGGRAGPGARAWPASLRRQRPRRAGARPVRRPAARQRGHAARQQHPDRGQRLGGARSPRTPPAQLRTIRALRDEGFDVLHLHEPLAPGRHHDGLRAASRRPLVGTFHAAGDARPATGGPGPGSAGWPAASTCAARCPRTPQALASSVPRRHLRAGVQRHRDRPLRQGGADARPTARRSSSSAATSPARAWRCCSRRWRRSPRDVRLWVGRRRARDRAAAGPRSPATPGSSGSGRLSDDEKARPPAGRRRLLRAVAAGRVLRRRAARGDGGRRPPIVASDLPGYRQRGPARPGRRAGAARATPAPWPRRCSRVLADPARAERAGGLGRGAGAGVLHGPPGRPLRRAVRAGASRGCPPAGRTAP